jgi:hypothetical protein
MKLSIMMVSIFNYLFQKSNYRPNVNILFICLDNSYAYKHLLLNLNKRALQEGYKSYGLYRYTELKKNSFRNDRILFSKSFFYGENHFNYKHKIKSSYLINKYSFFKTLNAVKNEILEIVDSNNIQMVLTFNFNDIGVGIIASFRKLIPIYYVQHSMIQSELPSLTIRQRYDNYLSYLFCGFYINRTNNKPPFNFKNINYVLWSELWADNIDQSQYKIKYFPKILYSESKSTSDKMDSNQIKNILVILNKKRNIGKKKWTLFANFYKEYFDTFSYYNVTFKIHPSEDINFCKDNLKGFNVIKRDLNIKDYDLVLSHWSSFIFESALKNIPFILINPKNLFSYKFWRLDHYPLIVSDIQSLNKVINDIKNKNINTSKILSKFVSKSLGSGGLSSYDGLFDTIFGMK